MKIYHTEHFRKTESRQQSRALLFRVLREACGLPVPHEIRTDSRGRRYIDERYGIFFSVTHTGPFWFCSVDRRRHGIDAELWQRRVVSPEKLAARFLTEAEQQYLLSQDGPDGYRQGLIFLWTRKEAYLKYTGKGLYGISRSPSVVDSPEGLRLQTFSRDRLCVSLCMERDAPEEAPEWICMDARSGPGEGWNWSL